MSTDDSPSPRRYLGVMVSSTFKDLEAHRAALLNALRKEELFAIGMEDYVPVPGDDVISSSLNMVRKGAAYIGLISHRCGQVLECVTRNTKSYSVTRLEFEEAKTLGLPTLIFVMSAEHAVKPAHVDTNENDINRLNDFRGAAKAGRIYIEFDSLEDFTPKAIHAVASLRRYIEEHAKSEIPPATEKESTIPRPPSFYAEPDYIGSHKFVGRARELEELSDWAKPADPTNLLLFEAIGGNGKSMLTWEWTTKHSSAVRPDWAGCFWYSFYEKGAVMADFCQRALAYMTGRPLEDFAKKKTVEMKHELLSQLRARPWLLILDGLERVLVAYHRIDAAEIPDEEANAPTDKIVNRNPCDAIRDEDNDLLRAFSAVKESKILISSRLTPRVLLNPSGQPISGARRITLPGLRPPDAEKLLRSCGIEGDSEAIQRYLTANCDNHPLVIGVLGGLISHYRENRGNFDAWAADPNAGGALDLAKLNLIQRRNHIFRAALDALSSESGQLLSTLALLTDSVDYETLKAFNPHIPPEPQEVWKPKPLEKQRDVIGGKIVEWAEMSPQRKIERQKQYDVALLRWEEYQREIEVRFASSEFREAATKLEATVTDLEQRGLLQWDVRERKYTLHPVVRGVVSSGMAEEDRERQGQQVVDHFLAEYHLPYRKAETIEDVRSGLHVVRMFLKLGRFQQAAKAYRGDLDRALAINLEAYGEILSLLRPFFLLGWGELPRDVAVRDGSDLANSAARALNSCGELTAGFAGYGCCLRANLEIEEWDWVTTDLHCIFENLVAQNRISQAQRVCTLALELANLTYDQTQISRSLLDLFSAQSRMGQWESASTTWQLLGSSGRYWASADHRHGLAEWQYAQFEFWQGNLREDKLVEAERFAEQGKDRNTTRNLCRLRGDWRIEQSEWGAAAASYQEAVRLARERSLLDPVSEAGLVLAKHYLGQLADPQYEVEQLAEATKPANRLLAQLWLILGEPAKARHHALAAYKWAWADGEPYVNRYELTKTIELFQQLGEPIPNLPPYDSAKDEKLSWEYELRMATEKLRRERESVKK